MLDTTPRQMFSSSVVFVFVVFFFTYALCDEIAAQGPLSPHRRFPDFSKHSLLGTLSAEEFPLDDPERQILIVGDIHGMHSSLKHLLKKASYDPNSDVLIHVGDVITKARRKQSMKTLEYLASNNITGVRGNHDQAVVEWRGWMTWIRGLPGGRTWLEGIYLKWRQEKSRIESLDLWLEQQERLDRSKWLRKIPKGWKLFDDHFKIAHEMTEEQYDYLRSLPLRLYIPSAHTYIVHGGLLSSNPAFAHDNRKQPLAHVPHLPSRFPDDPALLRNLQELSILNDIPQNTVPWNVLNMRSIRNGNVTKETSGKRWSTVWNDDMSLCHGFNDHIDSDLKHSLSCYPSTVIYGHSASRGLDTKRWSIGLDTGCVYGRRLTALVLGSKHKKRLEAGGPPTEKDSSIPFGDNNHGTILSVPCS